MKVKMLKTMSGPERTVMAQTEAELPDELALELIRIGAAESLEVVVDAPEIETAETIPEQREVAVTRRKRRSSKIR